MIILNTVYTFLSHIHIYYMVITKYYISIGYATNKLQLLKLLQRLPTCEPTVNIKDDMIVDFGDGVAVLLPSK